MNYLPTYTQFLTESSKEGFVIAIINKTFKESGQPPFTKGDEVKINALQYTKGDDNAKIDSINTKGQVTKIFKSLLTVKF